MDRRVLVMAVGTLMMVGATPACAGYEEFMGRTRPESPAEVWGDVAGVRGIVAVAEAAEATPHSRETFHLMGGKLGRGLANVSTGWMELPKLVYVISQEWGPVSGFRETFHGLDLSILRTLAGIYEVATFPVPVPAGYAPVISPPFVLTWERLYVRMHR